MDIKTLVNDALAPMAQLLGDHSYAKALLILGFALIAAKAFDWLMRRVIRRFTSNTRIDIDDEIAAAMHQPLFWTVLLIGALAALVPLEPPELWLANSQSIVLTVLTLVWSLFAVRVARLVLQALSERDDGAPLVQPQTLPLFENLALIIAIASTLYIIFRVWNIDMTAWLASAGIAGIAIGFAAKDTLANLFSGVFILADAPYKIGDFVMLDSGSRGEVTHIGIRSTRLRTKSDVEVTIPNSIMGNSMVTNESGGRHEKYRIRIKIGVAYGSDIDQVRAVLMAIGTENPDTCGDPEPRVRFRTFGDSSLNFELLCWIDRPQLCGRVVDAINTAIYKTFISEGIEIPYPQRDVHIKRNYSAPHL
jgi:small-conductance mechanosensitive channel